MMAMVMSMMARVNLSTTIVKYHYFFMFRFHILEQYDALDLDLDFIPFIFAFFFLLLGGGMLFL